jgi:tRNA-specific 2-thiouridylase
MSVLARVRYRQPLAPATLTYADSTPTNVELSPQLSASQSATVRVLFEHPQKAVAPGQSAVFYSKEGELLGGGVIL